MVESITDCAIVQLDALGRVLSWNKGAHRIKGWSAQQIVGQHVSRFYSREDVERGMPQRELHLAAEGRYETEGWRARKDGSRFWANVVLTAVRDSRGAVDGFAQLTRDFTEHRQIEARRKHYEERLESAALHDALTGLANRQLLDDRVSLAIAHARRNKSAMAVLFLDLDGFSEVNDALGHDGGDALLKAVAERLVAAGRAVDTTARLGGDEFGLVLWQIAHADDAAQVAAKLIKAVSQAYDIGGRAVRVTVSAGVAIYPAHGEDAAALLKSADLALHEVKHSGKNAYRVFTG
jgi:diguanylate cyclase (GGDEF)-like protein/PAS domain S-box-containing protein